MGIFPGESFHSGGRVNNAVLYFGRGSPPLQAITWESSCDNKPSHKKKWFAYILHFAKAVFSYLQYIHYRKYVLKTNKKGVKKKSHFESQT